ncbi:AAA family ATPase [Lacticaseibacillus sp. N501-2]|uniref:AAA family ATPase n=1 Tax=Lacticaseibacillus salsurae TaxID=3367729 RepID=UPI0038B3F3FD
MKLLLIGRPGAGKSTLASAIAQQTGWPILALDQLWHADDYSAQAKQRFIAQQQAFMAAHEDWLIDGNYASTLKQRVPQADVIVWVRCNALVALVRILRRSWRFAKDPSSRPEMPANFVEHWNREYVQFLWYVLRFSQVEKRCLQPVLAQLRETQRLVIVRTRKQKKQLLATLSR